MSVRVEYISGVVSRVVFQSCAGRNVVLGASGHCGFVEFIDALLIFCDEPPMNSRWIGLPLLDPEERLLAVTKSPQIGMTVSALVRHEELDMKRLQGRLVEGQRTFDIADGQNNVVEHRSPLLPLRAADAVICRGASTGQSAGPSLPARPGDRLPPPRYCY